MAQRSHVPKFGDWDRENIPYTTCFDNAKKNRGTGSKIINPNDPEQNPDAFIMPEPPFQAAPDRDMPPIPRHPRRKQHDVVGELEHQRESFDPQRSRYRKGSDNSRSGSERSSSDYSLIQSHQQQGSFGARKNSAEASHGFSSSSPPRHGRLRAENSRLDNNHHRRAASVPKFGAWDEMDPKSAEGFTVIFDRVKEEKHGVAKVPKIPSEPVVRPIRPAETGSSFKTKMCCCLFSSTRE
ncbi:RPM1-interacting protein 4 [Acorus calamus]|uniref:RPM1-interacting protein 4 n=1 Tax=Acorus calamus TaxID=4465 RepID=A0AAV9D9R6_ACOCL|nr:RPM1-interacting protein 4 [Acorus calamus]